MEALLIQPTPAIMPPRAEPPTPLQELEVKLAMAIERHSMHERCAKTEKQEINRLMRQINKARREVTT